MSLRRVRSPAAPKMTIMHGSAGRPGVRIWVRGSTSAWAIDRSPSGAFFLSDYGFNMSAEFLPHGRKHFLGKRMFLARAEAHEQGGGKHIHGNSFVDGGFDCQAAFARILDKAGIFSEGWILGERH